MKLFKEFILEIKIPKGPFSIPRREMPQIKSTDLNDFLKWVKKQGITFKNKKEKLNKLKVTQKDFDFNKIKELQGIALEHLKKKIIVSRDNYLLDGHHRFLALLEMDDKQSIDIIKIDLKIEELIDLVKKYRKSFFKNIKD